MAAGDTRATLRVLLAEALLKNAAGAKRGYRRESRVRIRLRVIGSRIHKLCINGETTINILNISDFLGKTKLSGTSSGLLALTVGKNGVSGELSSAGRNFSATTIAETIGGIGVADTIGWTNRYERKHSGDWGGAKLGTALRSQYGTGDGKAKRQARDIRRGKAELVNDTSGAVTGEGRARSLFTDKKRIYVNGSAFGGSDEGGLALGLVLQLRAFGKMQYSNNSESGSYPPD